jgi:ribulose-5-phosphate 4-epimerase/fuculose-1-phosphate aldolase
MNNSHLQREVLDIAEKLFHNHLTPETATNLLLRLFDVSGWKSYDWNKPETRPTKYGKYFVHRKDGKTHWETWNGSGWAYNGNVITFWMEVLPPCQ